MANRKIDMCEYKNVIQRLRYGESDRQISRETHLGRRKITEIRAVSVKHGWLMAGVELPSDESISQLVKKEAMLYRL